MIFQGILLDYDYKPVEITWPVSTAPLNGTIGDVSPLNVKLVENEANKRISVMLHFHSTITYGNRTFTYHWMVRSDTSKWCGGVIIMWKNYNENKTSGLVLSVDRQPPHFALFIVWLQSYEEGEYLTESVINVNIIEVTL